jgi:hypothetical protein
LQVAHDIGGVAGQRIVDGARTGFANGIQFSTLVIAAVIAVAVAVIVVFLPNRPIERHAVEPVETTTAPVGERH